MNCIFVVVASMSLSFCAGTSSNYQLRALTVTHAIRSEVSRHYLGPSFVLNSRIRLRNYLSEYCTRSKNRRKISPPWRTSISVLLQYYCIPIETRKYTVVWSLFSTIFEEKSISRSKDKNKTTHRILVVCVCDPRVEIVDWLWEDLRDRCKADPCWLLCVRWSTNVTKVSKNSFTLDTLLRGMKMSQQVNKGGRGGSEGTKRVDAAALDLSGVIRTRVVRE